MKAARLTVAISAVLLLAACGKESSAPRESASAPQASAASEEKVLNIYNWSDYIAEDTIANFEAETGIKVTYSVFDSNEVLEAKLMAGNTGYDLVVPSLTFLARQIQAGVFQPIDKSKLSNYGNLDPELMAHIATGDPGNTYSVPYMWGTTGIGYNVDKVKAALGEDAPVNSWDLVFKPENMAKLKGCGVSFLDTPQEIVPLVLNYLGEDPNSFDEAVIRKVEPVLAAVRPYIRYFHSSQYINDLANGDVCVAVGWSGDIFQARDRAEEAGNGQTIAYSIPVQGAAMWFDMAAIPKDAKHPNNAHLFLDYLLRPEVSANISNFVAYASANKAALALVDEELRNNPGVYPDDATRARLFTFKVLPPEIDRIYTRIWTTLKTEQ